MVGGSAAFRAFIAEELVPEIERRYRTSGARGIIGESLAGRVGVYELPGITARERQGRLEEKAFLPILVTLPGMVTLVRPEQP